MRSSIDAMPQQKREKKQKDMWRAICNAHKWEKDGKVMGIHISVIKMDGSINGKYKYPLYTRNHRKFIYNIT